MDFLRVSLAHENEAAQTGPVSFIKREKSGEQSLKGFTSSALLVVERTRTRIKRFTPMRAFAFLSAAVSASCP